MKVESGTMVRYVLLRHRSGSKAGQVERFDLTQQPELSFGRHPAVVVRYDEQRDDLVSGKHATLARTAHEPNSFTLTDLGSRNGTFVNRHRVTGAVRLNPGDVVQFGAGGPEFEFDCEPRPVTGIKGTREAAEITSSVGVPTVRGAALNAGGANPLLDPTIRFNALQPQAQQAAPPEPPPTPVQPQRAVPTTNVGPAPKGLGKATVERMITQAKSDTRRWMAALGLVLCVFAVGALTLAWFLWPSAPPVVVPTAPVADGLTDAQIAEQAGKAVASIDVSWKLINSQTGRQIFHQYVRNEWTDRKGVRRRIFNDNRAYVATYVVLGDGTYEPSLSEDGQGGLPIGGSGTGSGFVTAANGFIVTARHVGAGWKSRYEYPRSAYPGVIWTQTADGRWTFRQDESGMPVTYNPPPQWVPANTRQFGRNGVKWAVEGQNHALEVTLPGRKTALRAALASVSESHDVALLKVESPETLPALELHDNYAAIRPGDRVTVLGYPAASPITYGEIKSQDVFNREAQIRVIADPSLTPGVVGRVLRNADGKEKNVLGDSYQITANPGAGNSGGPVFDKQGKVIGVYYAGRSTGDTMISFVVPIRYAQELWR